MKHRHLNPRKERKYSSNAYLIGFDSGYNLIKDLWQGSEELMELDDAVTEAYEIESHSRQFAGHPIYDFRTPRQFDDYDEGFGAGVDEFVMENTL